MIIFQADIEANKTNKVSHLQKEKKIPTFENVMQEYLLWHSPTFYSFNCLWILCNTINCATNTLNLNLNLCKATIFSSIENTLIIKFIPIWLGFQTLMHAFALSTIEVLKMFVQQHDIFWYIFVFYFSGHLSPPR